jgi:quinol monooxygenase YgiN
MPALPWTQRRTVDPGRTYLAVASRLPLRRRRSIPGFLRDAMAIRRQLARAHGMVGYALDAELARKTFWTFSVWEDQASLDAFAASDPHRAATAAVPAFAGHQPDSAAITAKITATMVSRIPARSRAAACPADGRALASSTG